MKRIPRRIFTADSKHNLPVATKFLLISLTGFTLAGNNLRHNPDDLPVH
jgi:hypothetical protein